MNARAYYINNCGIDGGRIAAAQRCMQLQLHAGTRAIDIERRDHMLPIIRRLELELLSQN